MPTIANWNLRWASPNEERTAVITKRLASVFPDVAVLTEADLRTLTSWNHVLDAGEHPKAPGPDKRKVAIVSQFPMTLVDAIGSPALPTNNFLAVDVEMPGGVMRVIGVVVRWNQKTEYVEALPEALANTVRDRTILAGDFNLRIPNGPLSRRLVEVLDKAGLDVVTAGTHDVLSDELPLIDHIAISRDLRADSLVVWPRRDPGYSDGEKELTDHAGCSIEVR